MGNWGSLSGQRPQKIDRGSRLQAAHPAWGPLPRVDSNQTCNVEARDEDCKKCDRLWTWNQILTRSLSVKLTQFLFSTLSYVRQSIWQDYIISCMNPDVFLPKSVFCHHCPKNILTDCRYFKRKKISTRNLPKLCAAQCTWPALSRIVFIRNAEHTKLYPMVCR